jgi:hypothetical protein
LNRFWISAIVLKSKYQTNRQPGSVSHSLRLDSLGILGTSSDGDGERPQLPSIGIIVLAKLEAHPVDDRLEQLGPKLVNSLPDVLRLFPPDGLELAKTDRDRVPDGILGLASELGDEVERTRGLA